MIKEVEVQGVGRFKIKRDFTHRSTRPRLQTFNKGKYKEVSFNAFEDYKVSRFQLGFDYEGNEIQIKVIE